MSTNVYTIIVAVALSRPPGEHEFRKCRVAADSYAEALCVALQMAACTSVMPVSAIRG
jgi:hypothetical protein